MTYYEEINNSRKVIDRRLKDIKKHIASHGHCLETMRLGESKSELERLVSTLNLFHFYSKYSGGRRANECMPTYLYHTVGTIVSSSYIRVSVDISGTLDVTSFKVRKKWERGVTYSHLNRYSYDRDIVIILMRLIYKDLDQDLEITKVTYSDFATWLSKSKTLFNSHIYSPTADSRFV